MQNKLANRWFYGVDSIRFILAVIVVLRHFDNVYAIALKNSAHSVLRYFGYFLSNAFEGVSAVIAFFIISGFVIHYPNKSGIRNLKEFWIRRLLRIAIPLAVILLAGIGFNHPEKTVVWSLYCELIYYGIYPFLQKIKISWKTKFLIAYIISAAVICLFAWHDVVALVKHSNTGYNGQYWQLGVPLTWIVGLPCWLLGVLIAENIDNLNEVNFKTLIIYRILVYAISCLLCYGRFHFHISYILSMNIFAFILYKWIKAEITYFKSNKPNYKLEKLGKFSYSLYLCHPLFLVLLKLYMPYNLITYPVFVLLTIVSAYAFYRLIEKPSHLIARKINDKYNPVVN